MITAVAVDGRINACGAARAGLGWAGPWPMRALMHMQEKEKENVGGRQGLGLGLGGWKLSLSLSHTMVSWMIVLSIWSVCVGLH